MMVDNGVGLNRATVYAGASKTSWYRAAKRSTINPGGGAQGGGGNRAQALGDMRLKRAICGIIKKRPFYGTRRMAAQIRRETGVRVNRKRIQRLYRSMGLTSPTLKKSEIIRSNTRTPRPKGPNEFWEADMSYVWCGVDGWCCLFNVIGVYTRQWLSYNFRTRAKSAGSVAALTGAVAEREPDVSRLTLRVDNGSQYTSREFGGSAKALGIKLEYIYVSTPEQNGHIESFHKTLKKEYVWPEAFESFGKACVAIAKAS